MTPLETVEAFISSLEEKNIDAAIDLLDEDIANAVLFLASEESSYISGQTILVDGAASTQKLPSAKDIEYLASARPELLE